MPSKVDANSNYFPMVLNNNTKEPVETNKNVVHNDQHSTAPEKIHFTPGSPIDNSVLSSMNSRSSTSNSKSS